MGGRRNWGVKWTINCNMEWKVVGGFIRVDRDSGGHLFRI